MDILGGTLFCHQSMLQSLWGEPHGEMKLVTRIWPGDASIRNRPTDLNILILFHWEATDVILTWLLSTEKV